MRLLTRQDRAGSAHDFHRKRITLEVIFIESSILISKNYYN